jgi:CHRD domain
VSRRDGLVRTAVTGNNAARHGVYAVVAEVVHKEDHMRQTFDRRSVLGICAGGVAGAALLASTAPSHAATVTFKADLKGSSEVPPNQTTGTGSATATFDPATKELTYSGSFSGLTGPAVAAHFHGPAEAGKNAGVQIWISEKGKPLESPFKGSAKLTDAQAADLMAGQWYVNVHTKANPGGELRGQLEKS